MNNAVKNYRLRYNNAPAPSNTKSPLLGSGTIEGLFITCELNETFPVPVAVARPGTDKVVAEV